MNMYNTKKLVRELKEVDYEFAESFKEDHIPLDKIIDYIIDTHKLYIKLDIVIHYTGIKPGYSMCIRNLEDYSLVREEEYLNHLGTYSVCMRYGIRKCIDIIQSRKSNKGHNCKKKEITGPLRGIYDGIMSDNIIQFRDKEGIEFSMEAFDGMTLAFNELKQNGQVKVVVNDSITWYWYE